MLAGQNDDFDPFDPKTWDKKETPNKLTPEQEERASKAISEILEKYQAANELRQLCSYLKSGKATREFHNRLRKESDYKAFVDWLRAGDGRRERAIKDLEYHLSHVKCPNCGDEFKSDEVIDLSKTPFDWKKFEEEE